MANCKEYPRDYSLSKKTNELFFITVFEYNLAVV